MVHVSSHRHETRVSTTEREAHEVRFCQVSPDKHDNQQHEVRVSSQQRYETRISKPKCESRICSIEHELRISASCALETSVSELRRKVNIRSLTARVRRELKSSRPQILEAGLFDPPPTDLRDYLTKNRSVHQITPLCCCEQLITMVLSESTANSRCSNGYHLCQSLIRPKGVVPAQGEPSLMHSTLKLLRIWWVQALCQAELRVSSQ